MSEERNALAELAEFLSEEAKMPSVDFRMRAIEKVGKAGWERFVTRKRMYAKASRIIAELAKVNTLGPKHIPGDVSLYKAYAECRAIAEEGANDER